MKLVCYICKKTIPGYSASVEMVNEAMKISFSMKPTLEEPGKDLNFCPVCLQKVINDAKIEIYASGAAWKKFGRLRKK